jgi:hypothetical protein
MPTQTMSLVADSFIFPEREYGIVGGGVDETVAMQACMTAASAQGRIIILPPFLITVTQLIIPANGIQMVGQVGSSLKPLSGFVSTGANTAVLVTTALTRHCTLKNFKITGTNSGVNQHGLYLQGNESALFDIDGLYIEFCGGDGVRIDTSDYSYVLKRIYSTFNKGYNFNIDAINSPCVTLFDCYSGVVETNSYGFFIQRGVVEMINCNGLDGGTPPHSCVRVGDSAIGAALVVFRNCNFESFTEYGVYVDIASDAVFHNCSFVPAGSGCNQSIYMVQPSGKSYIDSTTIFNDPGVVYSGNPSNLPIKIYDRCINSPTGYNPISNKGFTYYNSQDGRVEPLSNESTRLPCLSVTAASYTERHPSAGYYGVNRAGVVTVTLSDPQSTEVSEGRVVVIKDESGGASGNNITINTTNARTIDGAASVVISTNYGRVTLVKRGNNYWRID